MTWQGKHPGLPSILLNSHMDVVPVYREKWIHDPFSAEKDASGNIYGRGSQDMKSVGIMYVEAVRRLKNDGIQLDRTVHISFVPDEEIGSEDGMKKWVETDDFRRMNIDCGLDESCASPLKDIIVYNAEKSTWYFNIHCTGQPSHSAMLQSNTAPEKLRYIIDAFMDFRQKEKDKLPNVPKPELFLGDITCVNGGIQGNIVPAEMVVSFDCRISIDTDHEEFERWINVCTVHF
ncbi:hypothetical protein AAG570_005163 [Ranatra chinensis]|uniref:N-acyl-L-amino-acid amidohydrolase n=1 Tax=Ranatra chinensis TaxID=642074 RepID=A0ABD0XZN6_9HEMI